MCPSNFITTILALTVSIIVFSDMAIALPHCTRCMTDEECNAPPPNVCTYGEYINSCGRRACAKGPGEKCGEKFDFYGRCGEDMICSKIDNRCHGCYYFARRVECFPNYV